MYIFKMPAKAYDVPFTYAGLSEFVSKGKNYYRKLGATLTVEHGYAGRITVKLYDTIIAEMLSNGHVHICEAINQHGSQATTAWIQKVLTDNKIPGYVAREKFKYWVAGKSYWSAA